MKSYLVKLVRHVCDIQDDLLVLVGTVVVSHLSSLIMWVYRVAVLGLELKVLNAVRGLGLR